MDAVPDNSYAAGIAAFERIYARETLSRRPRVEIFCSYIMVGVAFGIFIATMTHIEELDWHDTWITAWCLGVFVYELRGAATLQTLMFDEAIYRIVWRFGYPVPFLPKNRVLARVRDLLLVCLTVGLVISLAWEENKFFEKLWPPPAVRHVAYTGGG